MYVYYCSLLDKHKLEVEEPVGKRLPRRLRRELPTSLLEANVDRWIYGQKGKNDQRAVEEVP